MSDWLLNTALAWVAARWRDIIPYVLARLDEKSTWFALFTWVTVQAHISGTPAAQDAFAQLGLAFATLLGMALKSPAFHSNGRGEA